MYRFRKIPLLCLALAIPLLNSCKTVEFYDKEHLSNPLLQFDQTAGAAHFQQKTFYSREGSIGGFGTSAGGGCGCY